MNRKKWIWIIASVIVLIIAIVIAVRISHKEEVRNTVREGIAGEEIKLNFLDFTVYNAQGEETKLYDYQGKPIILNFWVSDETSAEQLKLYESIYPEIQDQIACFFIHLTDEETESQKFGERFLQNYQINLPVYYDVKQSAARSYQVKKTPTSIFIDQDGNVINQKAELISEDMLRANIDILLGNF